MIPRPAGRRDGGRREVSVGPPPGSRPRPGQTSRGLRAGPEELPGPDAGAMLSVEKAAQIAERSVHTIRRAYRSGNLIAWRDGNGRGVRIAREDLRRWMMATSAGPALREATTEEIHALEHLDMRGKESVGSPGDYRELLDAARARHRARVAGRRGTGRGAG